MALDHSERGLGSSRPASGGGIVAMFARHPTAPNLLMLMLILIGLFSLSRLNRQFFPDIVIPTIVVNVAWPGASAEDVEKNILDVLEPELRFIENVDEVISYAREGNATITLEFPPNVDLQKAQGDIEQAVSIVTTLPEDAERPQITRAAFFDRVAKISVSGPFSERALKTYAKRIRDGLLASGIDRVTLTGLRDEEIWVRFREADLQRLGLTLDEVAARIRENTQDQPAGTVRGGTELQLRASSERKSTAEIGGIELRATADGRKIFLRDVADVVEAADRDAVLAVVEGNPAIELGVERALTADTIQTMERMNAFIAKVRPELPPTLDLRVYDVAGKLVQDSQRADRFLDCRRHSDRDADDLGIHAGHRPVDQHGLDVRADHDARHRGRRCDRRRRAGRNTRGAWCPALRGSGARGHADDGTGDGCDTDDARGVRADAADRRSHRRHPLGDPLRRGGGADRLVGRVLPHPARSPSPRPAIEARSERAAAQLRCGIPVLP